MKSLARSLPSNFARRRRASTAIRSSFPIKTVMCRQVVRTLLRACELLNKLWRQSSTRARTMIAQWDFYHSQALGFSSKHMKYENSSFVCTLKQVVGSCSAMEAMSATCCVWINTAVQLCESGFVISVALVGRPILHGHTKSDGKTSASIRACHLR